jgi:hypothetical protein
MTVAQRASVFTATIVEAGRQRAFHDVIAARARHSEAKAKKPQTPCM